jgi:hypothetical protein
MSFPRFSETGSARTLGAPARASRWSSRGGMDVGCSRRLVASRFTNVTLWQSYPRREVAERFGLDYSRFWEQGVVKQGNELFLFVTLEKADLPEAHRYGDRFPSRDVFEWQSQNRTRRASNAGKDLQSHAERGITVHLFMCGSSRSSRGRARRSSTVDRLSSLIGRGISRSPFDGGSPKQYRTHFGQSSDLPLRISICSSVLGSRKLNIPNKLDATLSQRFCVRANSEFSLLFPRVETGRRRRVRGEFLYLPITTPITRSTPASAHSYNVSLSVPPIGCGNTSNLVSFNPNCSDNVSAIGLNFVVVTTTAGIPAFSSAIASTTE